MVHINEHVFNFFPPFFRSLVIIIEVREALFNSLNSKGMNNFCNYFFALTRSKINALSTV